jgi:hypothetical protein|tara:strand:+ start:1433 stop:1765 length:333 start_codon:yes stop_codon:yes gene_type:complete
LNNLVQLQIRKIIFDNFNDVDVRFNNDQILEFLKKTDGFDQSVTIDNLEDEFKKIEDDGFVRCIAQNFTTKWFKLYEDVEKIHCNSCNTDVHLGKDESRVCPNHECNANL